jgi:hypothetical protein
VNIVSRLGQNIQFVAFWAHFGVAALAVEHSPFSPWYAFAAIVVAASAKEFWFDATYERDPPQVFIDNLEDWIGWVAGAFVGVFLR